MRKKLFRELNRRRPEHDQLQVEHLESRILLAGNVLASVVNGTLTLLGDDANNAVQVSTFYDAVLGDGFRVEGGENNGPTLINGSAGPAEFFGVTNLHVDLLGGDDDFALTNDLEELLACIDGEIAPPPVGINTIVNGLNVPGWTVILMGDGDNRVGVGAASIGLRLLIETGQNYDQVGLCEVEVGTNLVIRTFGGADDVFIHDSNSYGVTRVLTANGDSEVEIDEFHAQNLVVRGGNHADDVSVDCFSIYDDLVVQTLGGHDDVDISGCWVESSVPTTAEFDNGFWENSYVGDMLLIQTADGTSEVEVIAVEARQINILGGIHRDSVQLEDVATTLDIVVKTLDYDDDVDVANVDARSLIIHTGAGDDDVFVGGYDFRSSYFSEDLIITTDSGCDNVVIGEENDWETSEGEGDSNGVNVGDDLVVETGADTDRIDIFNYDIGDNAVINAGAGDDSGGERLETFNESSPTCDGGVNLYGLNIDGNLTLLLGDGADSASVESVNVYGNAFVDAGAGDDGQIELSEGDLAFSGALGVSLRNLTVYKSFWLILGSGIDQASISDMSVGGNAYLNGGTDDDEIGANGLDVSENLYVFLGTGDDVLFLDDCSATNARLYGGAGLNDGYYQGVNFFGSQKLYDFEFLVA